MEAKETQRVTEVVGLTGEAGSGKSAAASHLMKTFGYEPVKFAFPLKVMLRAYYDTQGLLPEEIERRIEGDLKEEPDPYLNGHTPRHAMETLGTEWGRICMGDTFWIDAWRRKALQYSKVVVDDCRFDNEAQAIKDLSGDVIRLKPKKRRRKRSNHSAEKGVDDSLVDFEIKNDGTLGDLRAALTEIIWPSAPETFGSLK